MSYNTYEHFIYIITLQCLLNYTALVLFIDSVILQYQIPPNFRTLFSLFSHINISKLGNMIIIKGNYTIIRT